MFRIAAFIFAALTTLAAIFIEKTPFFKKRYLSGKMLRSLGFLLTGICASAAVEFTSYSALMLGGLLLGAVGDFFLDYKEQKHFLWGALFFGAGHILYILNFLTSFSAKMFVAPYLKQIIGISAIMVVMSVIVVLLNKLRFPGKFKLMIPYALLLLISFIISFARGMILFVNGDLPISVCLIGASALFIASDTALAISKFGTPPHEFFLRMTKRLVNLAYFPAQALFALSILFYNI